jgi:hypothetical protein
MNDGKLHGYCFYWDVTGIINVYKDGTKVDSSTGSRTENIPAGGTWVLGQDQDRVARRFSQSQAFIGEIRDVNIYGNFDKNYFKTVVGPAVSNLNTCKLKYKGNLIKSWDEFKMASLEIMQQWSRVPRAQINTLRCIFVIGHTWLKDSLYNTYGNTMSNTNNCF